MKADYLVEGNAVFPSVDGQKLMEDHRESLKAIRRLEFSMVGGIFLTLLRKRPWIESVEMVLSAHQEDDGDGELTKTISNEVVEIDFVNGVIPELMPGKRINKLIAMQTVCHSLWDDEKEIYESFAGNTSLVDVPIKITRSCVSGLLHELDTGKQVSGWDAFVALFPDQAKLNGMTSEC